MLKNNGWIPLGKCPPKVIPYPASERHVNGTFRPKDMARPVLSVSGPEVLEGDQILVWHALQGAFVCRAEEWKKNRFFQCWKRIPKTEWILSAERKPNAMDGDGNRCVMVRYQDGRCRITGWHQYQHDNSWDAWQRTPEPPEGYLEMRKNNY